MMLQSLGLQLDLQSERIQRISRGNWTRLAFAGSILIPLIGYLLTLSPTVQSLDSAELATGSYLLGIVHATGYPLYLLLGKLFTYLPAGDVAYRVNLMSALFAALTCGTVYGISLKLTRSWALSLLGALFWGFSFYLWQSAVVAEVYSLQTFLTGMLFWLLLKWDESSSDRLLYLFAGLYGLSLGNHMSGLLLAASFAYLILSKRPLRLQRWRLVVGMALCFVAGLSIYAYLPIRYLADPPLNYVDSYYQVDLTTPKGLLWMMSGQMYRFFAFAYPLDKIGHEILRGLSWMWRNFLGVGIPIGMLGLVYLFRARRRWAAGLLLALVLNLLFFANYRVVDKHSMFLVAYLIWALFIPLGYLAIAEWWSTRRDLLAHPSRHNLITAVLLGAVVLLTAIQVLTNQHWANHRNRWQWRRSAEQVLTEIEPNAVLASQWSPAVVLEYLQLVEGQRPDVMIVNRSRYSVAQYYQFWQQGMGVEASLDAVEERETAYLDGLAETRPVFIVDVDPDEESLDVYVYLPTILNNY
jgi:hypothetical protein